MSIKHFPQLATCLGPVYELAAKRGPFFRRSSFLRLFSVCVLVVASSSCLKALALICCISISLHMRCCKSLTKMTRDLRWLKQSRLKPEAVHSTAGGQKCPASHSILRNPRHAVRRRFYTPHPAAKNAQQATALCQTQDMLSDAG